MSIKAVLFDLGNVLLRFDFGPAFKRLSRHCKKTPAQIRLFFEASELEVLYDGGQISSLTFYRRVCAGLDLTVNYVRFCRIWNSIFTPVPGMARLVNKLEGKKRLVLISNTNAMHFEYLKKRYDVVRKFDRHLLSFEEKIRKPDERIYRKAQTACRAKPREIFYIDDREDLTSAARKLGFHVHTFRGDLPKLSAHLKKLRVL